MALSDEVTTRLGGSSSTLLIQLTNSAGTATTIDSAVLTAAAADAQGHFRRLTGLTPDTSLDWQLAALVQGTIAYLEMYKSRDSNIVRNRIETFENMCRAIRDKATILPQTNSVLTPSTDQSGAKPDMDRQGVLKNLTVNENKFGVPQQVSPEDV